MSFNLSQSAIKDLAKDSTCPSRWEHQWINKEFSNPISEPMLLGLWFEHLILGENAKEDELPPLPTTTAGKPTAAVTRMQEQADKIKAMLFDKSSPDYLGYTVTEIQAVRVLDDFRIVIDFLATNDSGMECMFDLKLTSDLENTYGQYAWGNVESLDLFQQKAYQNVYEQLTGTKLAENNILVADYSTEKRVKLFKLNVSEESLLEAQQRVDTSWEVVNHYKENGFPTTPSKQECANCPVDCPVRFIPPAVEIIELDI